MASGSSYVLQYRRKRTGKTNYKRRLNLLKSGRNRLVVRPTGKHIRVQLVEYGSDGDKILSQAHSSMLKKHGYNGSTSNTPAAYLTGLLCAVHSGGGDASLDLGLKDSVTGSKIYAAVKGAVDGGLNVACHQEMFPKEERIKGGHSKTDADNFESVKQAILKSKK
ncbi:MAG TPA: 50S ribosomal protein L18 [Candidatus Altiarchaeales archaeon]|nr:50S ribosomal protein L18 [Candidatus Altiarchaeales archaeon]